MRTYTIQTLVLLLSMHVFAGDFYVNINNPTPAPPYTSPATAARSITSVVPIAMDGDVIHVSTGLYLLSSTVLLTNDVTIRSDGHPLFTVFDGGGITQCFSIANAETEFHGITVRNGRAATGGAMSFEFASGLISNCIIENSRAHYGGGLYIDRSPVHVVNSLIHGNVASNGSGQSGGNNWPASAGGGLFIKTSDATVGDTVIANNETFISGEGGGIAIFHPEQTGDGQTNPVSAQTWVENCLIVSNRSDYTGGGSACLGANLDNPHTYVEAWFVRCRWIENEAQFGGGYYHVNQGVMPYVANSLFLRNRSDSNGAAIRVFDTLYEGNFTYTRTRVLSCTIVGNQSTNNHTIHVAGGVAQGGLCYIVNSVVWSNETLTDIFVNTGTTEAPAQEAEYNCLERDYVGDGGYQDGNITNPPYFADFAADDFRLSAMSSCIDTGLNSRASFLGTDFFGDPRIFGDRVDMGYDETYVGVVWTPSNGHERVTTYCPPGAVIAMQQATGGYLSAWQNINGVVTSATGMFETDLSGSTPAVRAIRAAWLKP